MTFYHDAGKGSKQRPIEDKKKFEDNWDRIFGKKDSDKTNGSNSSKGEPTCK